MPSRTGVPFEQPATAGVKRPSPLPPPSHVIRAVLQRFPGISQGFPRFFPAFFFELFGVFLALPAFSSNCPALSSLCLAFQEKPGEKYSHALTMVSHSPGISAEVLESSRNGLRTEIDPKSTRNRPKINCFVRKTVVRKGIATYENWPHICYADGNQMVACCI